VVQVCGSVITADDGSQAEVDVIIYATGAAAFQNWFVDTVV
jgi:hypothetical protein